MKLGQYEDSLGSYNTCLQLAPELSDVLLDVAEVHFARADYATALEKSEEFVRRSPFCPKGFAEMGRCYEAMNQPLAALASYECATRIDPNFKVAGQQAQRLRKRIQSAKVSGSGN